ncbi:hypothetical protein MH17539M_35430 [Enterobacter hormaechei]|nr:hypothetical protein MH17539M_35430 [Enterobacter hormaechei]
MLWVKERARILLAYPKVRQQAEGIGYQAQGSNATLTPWFSWANRRGEEMRL